MSYSNVVMPKFNIKESFLGKAKISYNEGTYYLYNGDTKWMSLTENNLHQVAELYSSYDQAYGDVLISGLGFGILPLWICNKPEVKSVTVIEISQDIIELFTSLNTVPDKMNIINKDILSFTTKEKYDCLLLDHYEVQDWSWKLNNMKQVCNNINHDIFWAWSLEKDYLVQYFDIYNTYLFESKPDLAVHWKDFIQNNLPDEQYLLEMPNKIINNYIYTYCNKHYLLEEN